MSQPHRSFVASPNGSMVQAVKALLPHLLAIYKGQVPSFRRDAYRRGGRACASLKRRAGKGTLTDAEFASLSRCLLRAFCSRHQALTSFVLDVLVPEATVLVMMTRHEINREDAEGLLLSAERGAEDDDLDEADDEEEADDVREAKRQRRTEEQGQVDEEEEEEARKRREEIDRLLASSNSSSSDDEE